MLATSVTLCRLIFNKCRLPDYVGGDSERLLASMLSSFSSVQFFDVGSFSSTESRASAENFSGRANKNRASINN